MPPSSRWLSGVEAKFSEKATPYIMLVSAALNDRLFFIHRCTPLYQVLNLPAPLNLTASSKSNRWLSGVEAIFSGKATLTLLASLKNKSRSMSGFC